MRKGQVFNLPITHIHRPPLNEKTGRRPLEIREPHKLHVQNLKKKMKINPHATVVPFILMVDPDECSCLEDFDLRSTISTTILSLGDHTLQKQEGSW